MAEEGTSAKSRWRSILNKKKDEHAEQKTRDNANVMDFLAPSIAASQERQDSIKPSAGTATTRFPKIDVAAAQRFPEAHDFIPSPKLHSAGGLNPNLKGTGSASGIQRRRNKGLRVTFAEGPPEIIGEGGDESEVAPQDLVRAKEKSGGMNRFSSIFRSSQRKDDAQSSAPKGRRQEPSLQTVGGDGVVGQPGNLPGGEGHVASQPHIGAAGATMNSSEHASPPLSGGADDFNFHPKRLTRTATGFSSIYDNYGSDDEGRQPRSNDVSPFADNAVVSGAGTGYSNVPDRAPTLPEIDLLAEESPLDYKEYRNSMSGTFSTASPKDPNSFSARLIHKMRAEEGKVLRTSMSFETPDSASGSDDDQFCNTAGSTTATATGRRLPEPPAPPPPSHGIASAPSKPQALQMPMHAYSPYQKPPQPLSERPLLSPASTSSNPPPHAMLQPSSKYLETTPHMSQDVIARDSRSRDPSPASFGPETSSGYPTPSPLVQSTMSSKSEYFAPTWPSASAHLDHRHQVPQRPAPQPTSRQGYQQPPPIQILQPPSRPIFQDHSHQSPPLPSPSQHPNPTQAAAQQYQSYHPPQAPNQTRHAPPSSNPPLRGLANRFADAVYSLNSPTADSARTSNSSLSLPNLTSPLAALSRQQSDAAADSALADFSERVQHMSGVFRLTAEVVQPAARYTATQWLRCCLWWFLRGRAGLEGLIRRHKRESKGLRTAMAFGMPRQDSMAMDQGSGAGLKLSQPHVDLAKVVWMINEIFPGLPALQTHTQGGKMDLTAPTSMASAREAGDAVALSVMEALEEIRGALKLLLASCAKNDAMPPHASLIQGQDQSIWVQCPAMRGEHSAVLKAGAAGATTMELMPVSDTKMDFVFGRMFVTAIVSTAEDRLDPMPCALMMMRQRNTWGLKVCLTTQSEAMTLIIQDEHERNAQGGEPPGPGPGWRNVTWDTERTTLHVSLPSAALKGASPVSITISFAQSDFMSLINMWNYTRSVAATMHASKNEKMLHEIATAGLQFSEDDERDSPQQQQQQSSTSFPRERIKRCRVRVFAKFEVREESTGHRRIQRGFRVLAVTSPKLKNLSAVSMDVGNGKPIACELVTDNVHGETKPALVLRMSGQGRSATMSMTFGTGAERQQFIDVLSGAALRQGEAVLSHSRFQALTIEQAGRQADAFTQSARDPLRGARWTDVTVIGEDESGDQSAISADTVLSDNIRIVARAQNLVVTETLSLVQGDLKVRVPAAGAAASPAPQLSIFRATDPAPSTTITMLTSGPDARLAESLAGLAGMIATCASIATFHFPALLDLHNFQAALTAHAVVFDALASGFTVSHRRNMVPIYKKQRARDVRVQVVKRDGETSALLLAFFEGYKLTEAMAFKMLSTDGFEKVDDGDGGGSKARKAAEKEVGGASWGVKLIDAKFPMPALRKEGEDGEGVNGGRWKHRRTKSREAGAERNGHGLGNGDELGNGVVGARDVARAAERFVSLDALEYPGEHDDIVVGFDEESERNSFLDALPAGPQMHRGLTLKRRI